MELVFTPSGRIVVGRTAAEAGVPESPSDGSVDRRLRQVVDAFLVSPGAGLFLLATERFDTPLSPSVVYWREFACRYLTELCQTPESGSPVMEPIAPPDVAELSAQVLNAPPLQGGEYLTEAALAGVWQDLDAWVRGEVAASGAGLSRFLQRRAPLWHQVGRVCFHLAENRRDQDYPFAFLATYAPGLGVTRASNTNR